MRVEDSYKLKDSLSPNAILRDGKIAMGSIDAQTLAAFKQSISEHSSNNSSSDAFQSLKGEEDIDEKLSASLKDLSHKADPSKESKATTNSITNDKENLSEQDQDSELAFTNQSGANATISNTTPTMTNAVDSTQAPALNAQEADEIFKIADSIVDKILVSDPKNSKDQLVTISFNQSSAIPQTDITLRRDLDGLLTIMISSQNPKSFNKLVAARDHIIDSVQKLEERDIRFELTGPDDNLLNDDQDPYESQS